MFLSADQLHELTGLTQSAAQVRWLRKNGIRHYIRADGRPSVPADAFTKPAAPPKREPNFEGLWSK